MGNHNSASPGVDAFELVKDETINVIFIEYVRLPWAGGRFAIARRRMPDHLQPVPHGVFGPVDGRRLNGPPTVPACMRITSTKCLIVGDYPECDGGARRRRRCTFPVRSIIPEHADEDRLRSDRRRIQEPRFPRSPGAVAIAEGVRRIPSLPV